MGSSQPERFGEAVVPAPQRRRETPVRGAAAYMGALLDDVGKAFFQPGAPAFDPLWLEALPIAAAIIVPRQNGSFRTIAANGKFAAIRFVDARPEEAEALEFAIGEIAAGREGSAQLDWRVGNEVAGREYRVTVHTLADYHGLADHALFTLIDRTHEIQTENSLRREMVSDSLTGLPNRSGFEDAVEAVLAQPEFAGQDYAIIVVDLARFSRINQAVGPLAGDELIITIARRLRSSLRSGDFIGRIGGNEFAIFARLRDGRADAREIVRRIRTCFDHPCRISELQISVDCAIGCAIESNRDVDVDDVVRHAQIAMKRAKQTDRLEIYEPTTLALARDRFSLETELRRAIETERLTLAFQPLIELKSGRVAGFEALARWRDPDRGVISPADFIPIAEDSGLIVPLGQWAIGEAARVLADWDARLPESAGAPYISVNISAIQLMRSDIPGIVREALAEAKISGDRLMLELTESAILGDPDHASAVLHELKRLKARIAMDDFGTGYSNLAYLQKLPIDVLKIDRSLVTDMLDDHGKISIVRAIQSLAETLDLKTAAEGVEDIELARMLAILGCDYGQGYHYAAPLNAADAYVFLEASLIPATI